MHGGLLEMKGRPAINSVVELTNLSSTRTASAQVISQRLSREGGELGVGHRASYSQRNILGGYIPPEGGD